MKRRTTQLVTAISTLSLGLAAAATLGLAPQEANAALTGNVQIEGTIAATCDITITGVGNYNNLTLSGTLTNEAVADVVEDCNNPAGFTVDLTSTFGAQLEANAGADTLAYTATYDGVAVPAAFDTPATAAQVTNSAGPSSVGGDTKQIQISTAAAATVPGTYVDTLTVDMTVN